MTIKTNPITLAAQMRNADLSVGVVLQSAPEIENQVTTLLFDEASACEIEYDNGYALEVAAEYYGLAKEEAK